MILSQPLALAVARACRNLADAAEPSRMFSGVGHFEGEEVPIAELCEFAERLEAAGGGVVIDAIRREDAATRRVMSDLLKERLDALAAQITALDGRVTTSVRVLHSANRELREKVAAAFGRLDALGRPDGVIYRPDLLTRKDVIALVERINAETAAGPPIRVADEFALNTGHPERRGGWRPWVARLFPIALAVAVFVYAWARDGQ